MFILLYLKAETLPPPNAPKSQVKGQKTHKKMREQKNENI